MLVKYARAWTRHASGTKPGHYAPRRPFTLLLVAKRFTAEVGYIPRRGYYPRATYTGPDRSVCTATYPGVSELGMKKRQVKGKAGADAAVHLAPMESVVMGSLHNIIAHCATTRYEDGDPRVPGWITVKTFGSGWVVTVKDPDAGLSLSATAATLDDALALADLLLGSEDAPWEVDQFLQARKPKKRA